ncbi:MAG: SLBB domain-containing protein [Ignavibacteria bacterium]
MKSLFIFLILLFYSTIFAQLNDEKTDLSSLGKIGTISVTIGGDFIITGSFPSMVTERVDQFVTRMYTQTREKIFSQLSQQPELLERAKKEIENYSLRDITLKRPNGEELKLDLMKFRRNGDFSNNPYLKNDDVLIFPPSDLERNFFSIAGAVNKPGKYHFKDGDKLSDAVELAQGLNKAYSNVSKSEINRLSYDGEKMEVISVDINQDFMLQRGDRIVVVAEETQKKEFSVTVIGEVKSPGKIPITKNTTTLKNVIEKAGGFTQYASLKRAKLFSANSAPMILEKVFNIKIKEAETLPQENIPRLSEMFLNLEDVMMYRMSNVTAEDTAYLFLENELRLMLEGGQVDFSNIENDSSETAKYIVEDGDLIIIPQKKKSVHVFGQVPRPGDITYSEGKNFMYYINKAVGLGEFALDEDDVMIIKGNTREWISPTEKNVAVEEGDYIFVPREMYFSFNYYVGIVASYLSVIASLATLILLIITI